MRLVFNFRITLTIDRWITEGKYTSIQDFEIFKYTFCDSMYGYRIYELQVFIYLIDSIFSF